MAQLKCKNPNDEKLGYVSYVGAIINDGKSHKYAKR